MQRFIKDPDATLDYTFDWSEWLGDNETIQSHDIDVDQGITVDSETSNNTGVTVWLSGGDVGETYSVSCEITTDNDTPRIDERTLYITVKER